MIIRYLHANSIDKSLPHNLMIELENVVQVINCLLLDAQIGRGAQDSVQLHYIALLDLIPEGVLLQLSFCPRVRLLSQLSLK